MSDYPSTLANLLLWIDGRNPAYSDTAGAVVATPFAGRARRVNYTAPAVGNAQAPDDVRRLWVETNALNFQLGATTQLNAPVAANCTQSAVTIAIAFSMRDKPAGAAQHLIGNSALRIMTFSDNIVAVNYNNTAGFWLVGPGAEPYARTPLGAQIEAVITLTPTVISASVVVDGTRTDYSVITTVASTSLLAANWLIGSDGTAGTSSDGLAHMALSQAIVVGHACNSTEVNGLLTFMRANPAPHFCPAAIPDITVSGDSIAAASAGFFGVPVAVRWSSLAQQILNATQPVNLINAAISGDSVVHQRDVVYPSVLAPFYDPTRAKNIAVLAAGTNDIATGGRTGPVVLADQYTFADAMIAGGKIPIVCTILARVTAAGAAQTAFNTAQTHYNTHLRAEAAARGYILCDFAAIPQLSDPTNATYYSDGIHPTTAGHALMAVVAAAAIQQCLSQTDDDDEGVGPGISNTLTYDQDTWHRPGIDELGGGSHENATIPRNPLTVPDARMFNQLTQQIVAQATLAPSVRLQVEFPGGVPTITGLVALNTSLVAADFTLTDNGNGDTSLTLAKYVGEQLRPLELTIVQDVEIDRWRVFPIAGGWRVKTKLGATGTNAAFVLALHAPAQH